MLDFIWLLLSGLGGLFVGYVLVTLIRLFGRDEDV